MTHTLPDSLRIVEERVSDLKPAICCGRRALNLLHRLYDDVSSTRGYDDLFNNFCGISQGCGRRARSTNAKLC